MQLSAIYTIIKRRNLLLALVKRDILGRYKGSVFGLCWSIIEPLVLLTVYTLVFGGLFRLRLETDPSLTAYAFEVFCAILPWLAISEGLNRCSTVVLENVTLVKKVIFPAEIIPLKVVLSAVVHQILGVGVLLVALIVFKRAVYWTWVLFPVLLLCQVLITAGIGWLIASIGVFIRDTRQIVSLITLCWMFLTPIFYPETIMLKWFPAWLTLNPVAALVHNYRNIFLRGLLPTGGPFWSALISGIILFPFGYWWFMKTKRAFVDVI